MQWYIHTIITRLLLATYVVSYGTAHLQGKMRTRVPLELLVRNSRVLLRVPSYLHLLLAI